MKVDQTEFIHLDEVLKDLKKTPDALELPVPRYFLEDREKELLEREKLLDALIAQYTLKKDSRDDGKSVSSMTLEEAVKIIQVNERGRQGRLRTKEAREMK